MQTRHVSDLGTRASEHTGLFLAAYFGLLSTFLREKNKESKESNFYRPLTKVKVRHTKCFCSLKNSIV